MYHVLASAVNHPSAAFPYRGLFNYRSLRSLADAGVDLDVVSPRPKAPPIGPHSEYARLPIREQWGPYEIHRPEFFYLLPKRLFYGLSGRSFASRLTVYADDTFEVPDVAHAGHIYLDGYGLLPYVRKHDIPLFVVGHGSILNTFTSQPRSVRRKVEETLEEATGVLCVSDALATKAGTLTDPAKVSTVPLGADPSNFPVERKAAIREELGLADDSAVVLFVGRFSAAKGVPEILDVVPAFPTPEVEFVFVGHSGDLRPAIRETLRQSGRPERVYWKLSPVTVRRLFAVADVLVLPSRSEGRPTVVYEAMASETAVLASTVGGIPEQVVDGETGLLVPPEDSDALREALQSMVADRSRLAAMGKRGHARLLEQGWTWSEHARRIREHHRGAL